MDAGLQRASLAEHPETFLLTEFLHHSSGGRRSSQNKESKMEEKHYKWLTRLLIAR